MITGLRDRQERFCVEVASGRHKSRTAAAIAAGYSEDTARFQASHLSTNPNVQRRIQELRAEAFEASGYSADIVKDMIYRRGFAILTTNLTDVVHFSDGNDPDREAAMEQMAEHEGGQRQLDLGQVFIVLNDNLSEHQAAAIKSLKWGEHGADVTMHDPILACKLMAEMAGLKDADTSVNVNISAAGIIQEVEERRNAVNAG